MTINAEEEFMSRPRTYVHKFGANDAISATTAEQVIWSGGGDYTFPTEATIVYAISDATTDQNSGSASGAYSIRIVGLDANWNVQQEDLSLNGDVTVEGSLSFIRVYRAYVLNAGGYDTNEGNIDIYQQQGGGDIKLATIGAGKGQTLQAVYTVPALSGIDDARFYGAIVYTTVKNAQPCIVELRTREFGGAWRVRDRLALTSASGVVDVTYNRPIELQGRTDIKLVVPGSGADGATGVAGVFDVEYSNKSGDN